MRDLIGRYREAFHAALGLEAMDVVPALGEALREAWRTGRTIYLCGNGGSAGNANHLANDFLYGAGVTHGGRAEGRVAERQSGGAHVPGQRHRLRERLRRAAAGEGARPATC